ncbi:MAG: pilus assembly protein PilM [Candidatus Dojkabacteria bacterium]|nr:MAG: pilus assembly protein PilM [Candidatus Dojkabacteria bacterium]
MGLPRFFGIDIGNHSIKAISLADTDTNSPRLVGYAYGSTPVGLFNSDNEEALHLLAKSIKEIIQSSSLNGINRVVFAVPESHVYRRLLVRIPYVDEHSLDTAVLFEMKKWLNSQLDDIRVDKSVIGVRYEDPVKVADVLGIAVKVSVLDKYLKVLELAGFEPIAAETEAIATVRSLTGSFADSPYSYMIVDFGSGSTDVSVGLNGKLIYSDSIPYGSDSVTKAIAQTFSMDFVKAEEYKKTYGIDPSNFNGKLANAIVPVMDMIMGDIRKIIEYFRREFMQIAPNKVFIVGDAANMPGLVPYMHDKLNVDIEIANPWATIRVAERDLAFLRRNASTYSVSIGLAKKTDI